MIASTMKPTRIFTELNNLWLFRDGFSLWWLVVSRDRRSFRMDKKCLRIQGILDEFQKLFLYREGLSGMFPPNSGCKNVRRLTYLACCRNATFCCVWSQWCSISDWISYIQIVWFWNEIFVLHCFNNIWKWFWKVRTWLSSIVCIDPSIGWYPLSRFRRWWWLWKSFLWESDNSFRFITIPYPFRSI